jgi:ATP-dependent DNA helicase RecQ
MTKAIQADCAEALARFGLSAFRTGQQEVIQSILAGQNCLCIMPTGGGKSLCYQLPSILREGVTIVISPLIALMKDQVDSLTAQGISATCINSTLDGNQQRIRLQEMTQGKYDLVYIAPERLRSNAFLQAIRQTNLQLLAIDEAHCISEWGHDFRPDYARIGRFRKQLGEPQTIALTATATETVREDIRVQLQMENPATFITGFARENLSFEVWQTKTFREKQQAMLEFIESVQGAGIVYAATRKRCEELVELLRENIKRRVGFYHAGLAPEDRRQIQEEFMSGEVPIIVATNAFGMGIDKSDLRFVVHYNLPGTIEAYYQEAGRAGRDGKPSRCLLLFNYADRAIQEFFIENAYPPPEMVKEVYEFLRKRKEDPVELTLQETKEEMGVSISAEGIGVCEQLLNTCGAIERLDSQQNMASVRISSNLPSLVELLPREAKLRRRVLREVEREVGELRGERVYFHPRQMADRLDMKNDALARSLRELNRLEAFDYVPPFRGKAVHVVDPTIPFSKLKVDFDELNRRRKAEYAKLDAVIQYAYTQRCRQLTILEYFGDLDRRICGNCDCCGFKGGTQPRGERALQVIEQATSDPALLHVVRIVLSGVARTHGRLGKILIGQMLWGSSDKKVKKMGLRRLSTFGMLNRLTQKEVHAILDALLQAKLLQQVETQKFRPVTQISPRGTEVMKGTRNLDMPLALPRELFERIRQFYSTDAEQTRKTDETGDCHPEESGSDAETASDAQAATTPAEPFSAQESPRQKATVDQSGNRWTDATEILAKAEALVDDALSAELEQTDDLENAVADQLAARNWTERESAESRDQSEEDNPFDQESNAAESTTEQRPDYYWTWLLFSDGYEREHVAAIRRLEQEQIVRQLNDAAAAGLTVEPDWAISAENLALLEGYRLESESEAAGDPSVEPPWNVPPSEFKLYFSILSNQ